MKKLKPHTGHNMAHSKEKGVPQEEAWCRITQPAKKSSLGRHCGTRKHDLTIAWPKRRHACNGDNIIASGWKDESKQGTKHNLRKKDFKKS